jgi:hypothetical protein
MVPAWLSWVYEHWQAIGSFAGLSGALAMLTRPRLRLELFGMLTGPSGDEMPFIVYESPDGPPVTTQSIFLRAYVWNSGHTTADDCTVAVDEVRLNGERAPGHSFVRVPLKWTMVARATAVIA